MSGNKEKIFFCFLSLLFALSLRVSPQSEDVHFTALAKNEGLSHETVYAALQDRDGFMWFATENGLNRFDGYDFTAFQHDPNDPASMSHSAVLTLYEDRDGILWIGTLNGGLNRYDRQQGAFRHYRHDPDRSDSLSNDIIGAILEDRDGAFWIGSDNGLNRLDRQSGKFSRYPLATDRPGASNHIHDICETRDGMLWIATFGGGLIRMERGTGHFVHYRNDPADTASLCSDYVYRILEDAQGALWAGTAAGLCRLDRQTGKFTSIPFLTANGKPLPEVKIYALYADGSGRLWCGTSSGLLCHDSKTGTATVYRNDPLDAKSLGDDQIFSIYEDRSGALWIGTGSNGINRFNPNRKKFSHYRSIPDKANSLGNKVVYAFWEDAERMLWIATHDGLDRLERETNTFSHFGYAPGPPGTLGQTLVHCLQSDRFGGLWLGTDGKGLQLFDRGSGRVRGYRHEPANPRSISSDRILALCEDRSGSLWIGTYGGGLNRMDRATQTFQHYLFDEKDPGSLSDNIVRTIMEDRDGNLWIGTYGGGLDRLDRATGTFVHYRHDAAAAGSLNNDYIFCLHEDRQGAIWIGTLSGGLNKLDRQTNTFSHYTKADGLASDAIASILEDRAGNLWLATSEGLSKFSPREKQFHNYDVSDGVQGKEFVAGAMYANRDGELFFGGSNGFNVFLPQNIFDNLYVPPVWITSFKVMNREVKLPQPIWKTREIVLSPKDQLFSFEYAALDYTAPEKNRYAYKLEGLTDDWIYTDSRRRMASFSRLPPGKYVFKVRGSNSDGLWNEKEAALIIRVRGPWWKSWWFLSLLAALTLFFLFQWWRTRLRRMAARVKTAEAMEELFDTCCVSPREREIALLLLKGLSNKEIGEKLFIELSTVKIHVHHILKKFGVSNRTQLLRLCQNLKLD